MILWCEFGQIAPAVDFEDSSLVQRREDGGSESLPGTTERSMQGHAGMRQKVTAAGDVGPRHRPGQQPRFTGYFAVTLVRNSSITKRVRSTSFIALHHPN
jgi:hypothetical protein